jgi:hypothetical protein
MAHARGYGRRQRANDAHGTRSLTPKRSTALNVLEALSIALAGWPAEGLCPRAVAVIERRAYARYTWVALGQPDQAAGELSTGTSDRRWTRVTLSAVGMGILACS